MAEVHATYFVMHIAIAVYPIWRRGALRATVVSVIQLTIASTMANGNISALSWNGPGVAVHVFSDSVASAGHYALHTALGITAVPRLFGSFWAWLVVTHMIGILFLHLLHIFFSMRGMRTREIAVKFVEIAVKFVEPLTNTAEALMIAVLQNPAEFADDGGDPGDVTDDVVHQGTQSHQSNISKEQEPKSRAEQEALRHKGKEVTDCRRPTTDDVYRAQFMPQLAVPVVVLSVLDDALSVGATPAATPSLLVFSKSKVMQRMCTWYHLFNWLCGYVNWWKIEMDCCDLCDA